MEFDKKIVRFDKQPTISRHAELVLGSPNVHKDFYEKIVSLDETLRTRHTELVSGSPERFILKL